MPSPYSKGVHNKHGLCRFKHKFVHTPCTFKQKFVRSCRHPGTYILCTFLCCKNKQNVTHKIAAAVIFGLLFWVYFCVFLRFLYFVAKTKTLQLPSSLDLNFVCILKISMFGCKNKTKLVAKTKQN